MQVLLVIDDEPLALQSLKQLFSSSKVEVLTAATARAGIQLFRERRPDVLLLDVHLPDLSGLEIIQQLRAIDSRVPIILMTGDAAPETAIEAMLRGVHDYVVKPLDPHALRDMIERAFEIRRLMRVPARLADPGPVDDGYDVLIGRCPAMQDVYKAIGRVAKQDVTVLILGESGAGKELVARAIYHYSDRSTGPFLTINCAAIPETLLESELFGHEKGSFTGADRKRIGKFEQCDGGTLFLDEIGDMTPLTQTKVLRVLQEKTFTRVGGNQPIGSDVRIIAATNRNLETMMAKNQFRSDLYYRLNVFTIKLPPLRERNGDLPLLVTHFLRHASRELGKEAPICSPEALEFLARHPWPGNVRELQSVLKQALLEATAPVILPDFLPASVRGEAGLAGPGRIAFPELSRFVQQLLERGGTGLYAAFQEATERQLLFQVLRHSANNLTHAARILGMSRATLRSKLAALKIPVERESTLKAARSSA
ncbi:MAG: sigma-54 dependent transcriptional regulator [Gemmataceae bacterium]